ncbi:MAG TPA: DUF1707 domain-containing protein [Solirubrobacteraceae bacterium]|nr:DUF1707 domain-containing protein [Solirubrobacteraceae bacterium]
MDPRDELSVQRAGDADRDAAAQRVRAAGADGRLTLEEMESRLDAVLAARTFAEIDHQLRDLRGRDPVAHATGRRGVRATSAPGPGREITRTITIMSSTRRRGFWRPAARSRVINVMGDAQLDLSGAELSGPVTELRVLTIMGSTLVTVPDDAAVDVAKVTIIADNDIALPHGRPAPGAPQIRIRLISLLGSARVRVSRRGEAELYA